MNKVIILAFLIDFILQDFVIKLANGENEIPCVLNPYNQLQQPDRRQLGYLTTSGIIPKKSKHYDPNYGYEPYWAGGDWVFSRHESPTTPSEDATSICIKHCPALYQEFGEVCGRNLTYYHKSFNNYCELLNEDCTGRAKWLIAYRGKCQDEFKTYPTKSKDMVTRALQYISDLNFKNPPTVKLNIDLLQSRYKTPKHPKVM